MGTEIRHKKGYLWYVMNRETKLDVVIVELKREDKGEVVKRYNVDRWGYNLIRELETFDEAKRFAYAYVEKRI